MEILNAEGLEIAVQRKRIKNVYVKINSFTGETEILAPLGTPLNYIEKFFRSKIKWIKKHKELIAKRPPVKKNQYCDGEKIQILGKEYVLRIFNYNKKPRAFLTYDFIDLYISASSNKKEREKTLDVLYKEKLSEIAGGLVKKWLEKLQIKAAGGFFEKARAVMSGQTVICKEPQIIYKQLKSKWGLCQINDAQITLNVELAKKTPACVEYVVAHELLHLKERKHNKSFKDYMKKSFPEWKKFEEELKIL